MESACLGVPFPEPRPQFHYAPSEIERAICELLRPCQFHGSDVGADDAPRILSYSMQRSLIIHSVDKDSPTSVQTPDSGVGDHILDDLAHDLRYRLITAASARGLCVSTLASCNTVDLDEFLLSTHEFKQTEINELHIHFGTRHR